MELTGPETSAIAALEALSRRWPESLWLFSAAGTLHVMKKVRGRRAMTTGGGVDPDLSVATVHLENDGGDW